MYAFSITFKLLSLYLAWKYGGTGRPTRPWYFGIAIAVVFSVFDVCHGYRSVWSDVILCVAYLMVALVVMHLYYRIYSPVGALLTGAIGGVILFLGVPYFVDVILK